MGRSYWWDDSHTGACSKKGVARSQVGPAGPAIFRSGRGNLDVDAGRALVGKDLELDSNFSPRWMCCVASMVWMQLDEL